MKRTVDSSLTLSPTSKNTTGKWPFAPHKRAFTRISLYQHLYLGLPDSRTVRKQCLSFTSHPVHGFLLYQPKLITILKLEQHLVFSFSITYHLSQLYIDNDSWAGDHEQKLCRGTSWNKIVSALNLTDLFLQIYGTIIASR